MLKQVTYIKPKIMAKAFPDESALLDFGPCEHVYVFQNHKTRVVLWFSHKISVIQWIKKTDKKKKNGTYIESRMLNNALTTLFALKHLSPHVHIGVHCGTAANMFHLKLLP